MPKEEEISFIEPKIYNYGGNGALKNTIYNDKLSQGMN